MGDPIPDFGEGHEIEKITPLKSIIYQKIESGNQAQSGQMDSASQVWRGTETVVEGQAVFEGGVYMTAPQGDISMGVFGDQ